MKIPKVVFVALLCMLVAKINAQNWRFGVHGTPTFSYISTSQPDASNGLAMKFGFGLLTEYKFTDNYALASGIDIVNRGGKLTAADTSGSFSTGFVEIPVTLKMTSRQFGYFTYFARFGGVVGIKTSENIEYDPEVPETREQDSYVNFFNVGFRFGAGAEYSLGGSTSLVAELTYNRSLIDNLNINGPGLAKKYTYRFDYVALSIGIIF